jgi:predicted nucleic acid-binding protein
MAEYLGVFRDVLEFDVGLIEAWRDRFSDDTRSTEVNLGRRYTESRDPDDNIVLATAHSGRAAFPVTNDRDLLDLPHDFVKRLNFEIVTPAEFLRRTEAPKK